MQFFRRLLDTSDFPARWGCGNWSAGHGWLHVLSDLGVWSAYFAIPFVLAYLYLRRKDLPFRNVRLLFGAFILLCGTTHLMEAVIFWWPAYRLAGVVKSLTAVVSWMTVFALVRAAPTVVRMRTPEELEREIAARKEVEERLGMSERRLRLAMEAAGTGMWEWDTATRVVRWSPKCHAIHGVPEGEFDGTEDGFDRLVHPADRERVWAAVKAAAEGRTKYECEFRIVRPDGEVRWVANVGRAVYGEDGRAVTMIGTINDITARKNAEERLRANEERLRASLEASGAGSWWWDADGGTSWDDQFHTMYGLPPNGPRTLDGWIGAIHPDDRGRVQARIRAVLETPGDDGWRMEFRASHPAGERWMSGVGRAERDAAGRLVRMRGLNLDVTEGKRVERQLDEARQFLRASIDALSSHIAVLDENGVILAVNEAWRRFADANRYAGRDCGVGSNYLPTSARECDEGGTASDGLADVLAGRRAYFESEYPCHSPDEERWFVMRVTPFRWAGPVRVVVAHEDVTRRRKAEQESEQSRERLAATQIHAPVGIVETTPDEAYVSVNDEFCRITGYTRAELLARRVQDITHPDDYPHNHDLFGRMVGGEFPSIRLVKRYVRKDGSAAWVDVRRTLLRGAERQPLYAIGAVLDITARREAEERLRESEERLRLALDSAGMGCWEWNVVTGEVVWATKTRDTKSG